MISLVIPNYNKAEFLPQTLGSALAQTAAGQIIVIDDASTDGSVSLLERAAEADPRVQVVCLDRNHNASYCRNRGLERATGEYVAFLDSDDILAPHCLASRLRLAERHPDHDMWVFPMHVFRESPDRPVDTWIPRSGDHLGHFLSHRLDWQTMQPLWRRSFLEQIGGFDESFARLQDPEIHARALLAGARVKCFSDVPADCFYRAFADADAADIARLSARNLEATLHFYRSFISRVPPDRRKALAGTLFASLTQHTHWWRGRRLSTADYATAAGRLVTACEEPRQRLVLAAYLAAQRLLPVHVAGVNRATRMLLALPH